MRAVWTLLGCLLGTLMSVPFSYSVLLKGVFGWATGMLLCQTISLHYLQFIDYTIELHQNYYWCTIVHCLMFVLGQIAFFPMLFVSVLVGALFLQIACVRMHIIKAMQPRYW